ncbi:glycosyltransferase, partial [Winogradskyella sp.]|uniref:glycosyltransferase n=1 Tax=Winogradskyella sp. TaxID=1883156 RepID=UPI003AB2DD7E
MKVLQVIDKLNVGGAERVCVDLTNLMFEKNINVSILTFDSKGKLQEDLHQQIFKINLNRKNKYNILKAYRLSKIIKQYDIVHVHMRHVYRYVKLVSLLFFVKTPVILHDHTS